MELAMSCGAINPNATVKGRPYARHVWVTGRAGGYKRQRCKRCGFLNPKGVDPVARFWGYVDKRGPNGCWVWTASLQGQGYGNFATQENGKIKMNRAHRYCWQLLRGEVPKDMVLDHLCYNRACVNPDHLEIVTMAENFRRGKVHAMESRK